MWRLCRFRLTPHSRFRVSHAWHSACFTFCIMKTQRTTEFLADTGDIFTAMLTGGGVRVYMRNKGGIDLPASHPLFAEAVAQTDKTVEAFFDSLIERGVISLRDIK